MPIAFEPVLDDKKLSMWKRGKGGRLLPILTMKRKNGKVLEIDPSKLKERITIFNDDKYIPTQSYQLTWSYDQPIEQEKQPQKAVIPTFDDEISQKLKEEKARSLRLLNTMFSTAEKPQHEMQQSVNINSDDSSNDEKIQNLDKKRKLNIETDLLEEDENKIKPKEKKKKINPKIQQSTSNGKDNRFIHINTDLLSLFKGNTTFTISAVPPDTPKKIITTNWPKPSVPKEISDTHTEEAEPSQDNDLVAWPLFNVNDFKNKSTLIGATFVRDGPLATVEAKWKETCQPQTRDYKKKT